MMKLEELKREIDIELVAGRQGLEREVRGGYVSDLLSDVIGNSSEGEVWVTIQTHLNIVAVASLKEHAAVIIAGGNRPGSEVIEKADEEGIPVFCCRESSFVVAGRIYRLLNG